MAIIQHDKYLTSITSDSSSISSTSGNSSPSLSDHSPYTESPWIRDEDEYYTEEFKSRTHLISTLFREEGHIHSLAVSGDMLYTGSESKNIRAWKKLKDFTGFKSGSGFVKAIVVLEDMIFTGHHDGKIRVWRFGGDGYKRVGNLPMTRDLLVKSVNPRNYVQRKRKRNVPWVKHYDAVSCMSIDSDSGLLYSGSWDKTLKVWRISDFKCLGSVRAHDDSINSVVVGIDGLVFTGSADGSVKAWRREVDVRCRSLKYVGTLLKQDHAVTSLVVSVGTGAVYAGTSDGLVRFWERENHFMAYSGVLRGHKTVVLCLASGGNLIVSGSADNSICVWRRDNGGIHTCATVLRGHSGPIKCLAMEKDTSLTEEGGEQWVVYSGSLDQSVGVWRVNLEHHSNVNELNEKCQ